MIDTYLLEQLAAVDQYGTLSAASEHLHLTQPSLTRSMQKLESILDVKLFDRGKNRVTLNENGRLAAECARHILTEEESMVSRVRALDRSKHTISVGALSPGPVFELSPLLSSLYSDMTIVTELRDQDALLQGLSQGFYQMIFLNQKIEREGIACHPCGDEHLYFSVPKDHRIASMKSCSFDEMNGESFLMASDVGYWDKIVREQMPDSQFLLQDSLEALDVIIHSSSLPSFATDVTMRLSVRNHDASRAFIPISGETAIQQYYCLIKTENEKRFLSFIQNLERQFG